MSTTDGSKSSLDPLGAMPDADGLTKPGMPSPEKPNPDKPSAAKLPNGKTANGGKAGGPTPPAARQPQSKPKQQAANGAQQPATRKPAPAKATAANGANARPTANHPGGPAPKHLAPNAPTAGGPDATNTEDVDEDEFTNALGGWLATVPAWLISMVFHIAMLLVLALLTLQTATDDATEISLHEGDDPTLLESTDDDIPTLEDSDTANETLDAVKMEATLDTPAPNTDLQDPALAMSNVPLIDFQTDATSLFDPSAMSTPLTGSDLESRGSMRGQLLREGGGTPQSEEAVKMALEWIANHQYPDGSWSFDHSHAQRCNGRCTAPGSIGTRSPDAPNAATALGLLPFLGAGFTHQEGKYRGVVDKGLKYLMSTQSPKGSWHEATGTMYSHGLCSIAICEAYAMTKDPKLRESAQKAVDFIEDAQDKTGGGWRYYPGDMGDTSVVGWQVMALKSAQMGYLTVKPGTIQRAESFLNSVSRQSGSLYGYQQPGATKTLTSVGLLCRMYMGWQQDQPALARGVQFLSETGPDVMSNDVYYNYYATQVLRHYDGPMWTKWNEELREHLIKTQITRDHERGSWYSDGSYNKTGGRHYTTTLTCMTLEVYYRHMPLYKKASNMGFDVENAFDADGDKKADDTKDGDKQADGNKDAGANNDGGNADDGN